MKKSKSKGTKSRTSGFVVAACSMVVVCGLFVALMAMLGWQLDGSKVVPVGYNKLSQSEQVSKAEELKGIINAAKKDGYFKIVEGEDSEGNEISTTFAYNSNGEAVAQSSDSGYITVFLNDGKAIRFTDVIAKDYDIDVLATVLNSLNLVSSGRATIYSVQVEGDAGEVTYKEFSVLVSGASNVKGIYEQINGEMAEQMIAHMIDSVGSSDFNIRYNIGHGSNGELSILCSIEIEGESYVSWYVDGYLTVGHYDIDESWYTFDFQDAEEAEEMLNKLMTDIGELAEKYAEENNIDTDDLLDSTPDYEGTTSNKPESSEEPSGEPSEEPGTSEESEETTEETADNSEEPEDNSEEPAETSEEPSETPVEDTETPPEPEVASDEP